MSETPNEGRPRLLDLFCGAGGCTKGYQRAGFYVVGVDRAPMPNYCGDEFWQFDAIEVLNYAVRGVGALGGGSLGPFNYGTTTFDAIHASPPCQAHSLASLWQGAERRAEKYPELVGPTRELLKATGLPYVIENVVGAPLRRDLMLCGEMFGLGVHRHRVFETEGFYAMQARHSPHLLLGAEHNCDTRDGHARQVAGNFSDLEGASEAMGIDWMTRRELAQAIPPAYCQHIGAYLMAEVNRRRELVA